MTASISFNPPPQINDPVLVQTTDDDNNTLSEIGLISKISEFDIIEIWLPKSSTILILESIL